MAPPYVCNSMKNVNERIDPCQIFSEVLRKVDQWVGFVCAVPLDTYRLAFRVWTWRPPSKVGEQWTHSSVG